MKRICCLFLTVCLTVSLLTACGGGETTAVPDTSKSITFTDSAGRQVPVHAEITRVAPSGAVATMFLASVCPDYMVCIASNPSDSQCRYLDSALLTLPATGQLYGSKGTINLEALMNAQPQVIIDLGDAKDGIGQDMDALQEQTGIPTVFIEADLPHMAEAFRMLGQLLGGKTDRCAELAQYVEETVALAEANAARIPEAERKSVMYTSGVSGLDTNAAGSTQAQVLELIGAKNAVTVENVSNKGGGNPINMEQLYLFDPDVILFAADSMYSDAASDPAWRQVRAIQEGQYCEIPALPYNWMSNPPSLNMLLGIRWLGNLLYPDVYDYDMTAEAQRAYRLLWGYELSGEEAQSMLQRSTLREAAPQKAA